MKSKYYLAGRWAQRELLKCLASQLEVAGLEITSGWLREAENCLPAIAAQRDLDDIDRADGLILYADNDPQPPVQYGGMFAELGYAIAKGKKVLVVCPDKTRCIFIHLPQIQHLNGFTDLFIWAERQATIRKTSGRI